MTRSPRFSVVIPTFGRPAFLAAALQSVLSQNGDLECVVVNDAGPVTAVPADSRVVVVNRSQNGGPAAARNTGVEHASGEVLLFLDDDDLFTPERLTLAEEGLRRAPLALCWSRFMDHPERPQRRLEGRIGDEILDAITPHLGTVAVSRSEFVPFDESYNAVEDVEWWLRTAQRTDVATVPGVGCLLRQHTGIRLRHGTDARLADGQRLIRDNREYFEDHPRAAAFRWRRVGLTAAATGDRRLAARAYTKSLTIQPSWPVVRNLAALAVTTRVRRSLSGRRSARLHGAERS